MVGHSHLLLRLPAKMPALPEQTRHWNCFSLAAREIGAVTFAEALAYLQSLQLFGFRPGLATTLRLTSLVGHPHEGLQFIHVAGTNGKGSVCAMLESVYRASGRRVGLYTSPHLIRFGERIQIDREPLPENELARLTHQLKSALDVENARHPAAVLTPTFFEFTTVLALMWFAEQSVDLVVWETGLGGRWDATNIVKPLASVITNIALDHEQVLGTTTAAIAAEKAGIIKPEVPVVTATDDFDGKAVIEFRARELDVPCLFIGPSEVTNFRYPIGLLGAHQRINGALTAATIRLLRARLPVSDEQLAAGLASVQWEGRLQRIQRGSQTLLLDGAHNRAGITALQKALAEYFAGRRPTLILGMLADKAWREMAAALVPLAGRILTVPVASPRTVSAQDVRSACLGAPVTRPVKAAASVAEALKLSANDPLVVITGSLYLVGEALAHLEAGVAPAAVAAERRLNDWSPAPATARATSGSPAAP